MQYLTVVAILASVALAGHGASADEPATNDSAVVVHKGLVYSNVDRELRMDLVLPRQAVDPTACVMVIQGGGFAPQDGQRFHHFARYLAEHGYAAAVIAYRGRPEHHYQDTVADIKAAVRYVRKVSGQYNIDPNRIGAMGRSAGGTLAALLAVTGGDHDLEGKAGHPDHSSRIQAAVAFAGVFDFVSRFTDEKQISLQPKVDNKLVTNGQWIGAPFSPTSEHWIRASAIHHVDQNDPPVLFLSCRDDATVPWIQSQWMHRAMKDAGIQSEIKLYDTGGHSFGSLGEEPMADMVRFFDQTLR